MVARRAHNPKVVGSNPSFTNSIYFIFYLGEMVEWSIASDLKSEEFKEFREFESHSLLKIKKLIRLIFCFYLFLI